MNWYCEKCRAVNEAVHRYQFCWNCGTAKSSIAATHQSLTVKDFSAYINPQKEGAFVKRTVLLSVIGLLLLISLLIFGLLFLIAVEVEVPITQLSPPIGLVIGILILLMRRRARKHSTKSQQKMLEDKRAPILYLRPFTMDADSELVLGQKTLEELIVSVLNDIGPTVAVGVPGEDLPALGAISFIYRIVNGRKKLKNLCRSLSLLSYKQDSQKGLSGSSQHQ
jgi:uncharacterized integral membrane protein